jgi:predicted RNA-binding protein with RPS1 domain
MIRSHVVVDGSNIATEGRTTPSLRQLDDAVKAFLAEHDVETLTVVVDATFPNRIATSERDEYEEALLAGELVTPPAGAIGRGDAFILQIAEKVGATVLSNDSFQELHPVHPWLFDEGRLIGGKPVPGVGWVFLLRSPVRGPVSRKATQEAKAKKSRGGSSKRSGDGDAPTKGAKASKATDESKGSTRDSSGRRRRGGRKRAADTEAAGSTDGRDSRSRTSKKPAEAANEPLPFIEFVGNHPIGSVLEGEVETFSSHGAYVLAGGARCYVPLKLMGDPAPRAARDVLTIGESRRFAVHSIDTPRRGIDLALVAGPAATTDSVSHDTTTSVEGGPTTGGSTSEAVVGTTTRSDEHAEEAPVSPVAKKAATKKSASKKAAAKKAPAKKTAAKKTTAKKAPAKKTAAKKTTAKKAPAKKTAATKTTAKKAPARR